LRKKKKKKNVERFILHFNIIKYFYHTAVWISFTSTETRESS